MVLVWELSTDGRAVYYQSSGMIQIIQNDCVFFFFFENLDISIASKLFVDKFYDFPLDVILEHGIYVLIIATDFPNLCHDVYLSF